MVEKETQLEKIKRMSQNQKNIRNIATSAHIHHGKTAFTDNLLAAAGMMSQQSAGDLDKGMQTWQHSDEQERLLTVDAANVSMVHTFHDEEFLINLIDTPGHIDFGGNVTRAMRAIDGTVVLVCASEGIMPQTETVLKQALKERVKPVLFINKVDRLIKEMQYTPEQIQQKFVKIIAEFNVLIEEIAEADFKEKWKVSITDGSVVFGSARDNWALSLQFMQKKGVTFKDILKIYDMNEKDQQKWVWENAPLHEVILDMVITHLPNPVDAQKYRIPKIWHGELESPLGKSLINCDPKGKIAFVITRIVIEPRSGREISAGRLFGGTIREGMTLYLNNGKMNQRVAQVFMYQGIRPENVGEIGAGNVIALAGINGFAGETLTEEPDQAFQELKHIFEPVITKAIEPAKPQDLSKLVEVLRKVAKEDPSIKIEINQETGENIMSGMGELHLEIVENRIVSEKGVQIKTSPPIVVYRESITKKSPEVEGKSPNRHNKFYFTVEPLPEGIRALFQKGEIEDMRIKKKDLVLREKLMSGGFTTAESDSVKDIFKGNLFMDFTKGCVHIGEVLELVLDMFEEVMKGGPLAREPCFNVMVKLTDIGLHEDAIHRGPAQVYPAIRDGVKLAIMNAGPIMFEPMQVHLIEAPVEFMGDMSKLVGNKRGQLLEMNQEGAQSVVKAKLPVAEMLGWSSDLRSATGGRGVSSLMDQSFERMSADLANKVMMQIRQRKNLKEGQVGA